MSTEIGTDITITFKRELTIDEIHKKVEEYEKIFGFKIEDLSKEKLEKLDDSRLAPKLHEYSTLSGALRYYDETGEKPRIETAELYSIGIDAFSSLFSKKRLQTLRATIDLHDKGEVPTISQLAHALNRPLSRVSEDIKMFQTYGLMEKHSAGREKTVTPLAKSMTITLMPTSAD